MKRSLSSNELQKYLSILKDTMLAIKLDDLYNVIFLDSHSFYCYLAQFYCAPEQTVGDVLNNMEDCIPFAITDNSFSMFLSAAGEGEAEKMEALRRGFIESCKTDFLLLALQLCDSPDWDNMAAACEDLRQKSRFIT